MSSDFIEMVSYLYNTKYTQIIQAITFNKIPCGLFVISDISQDVKQFVDYIKSGGFNITSICVLTNEQKNLSQPTEVDNIISIEDFPKLPDKPSFIIPLIENNNFPFCFVDYFKNFGTNMIHLLNPNTQEILYNFYMSHLSDLYDVHEMLADEESKKVFRAAIIGKQTMCFNDFCYAPEPQYFLNGFLPEEGDIAIDGGAYDGNTSKDFVRQGAKVYAFEMDANNYKKCLPVAEKYGFTIENLGLSNQVGEEIYLSNDTASNKVKENISGGIVGHFTDLDSYVERKNLPRVDYIKLDIEGAELDMLHGAAKTITRWKPKMAVSAYHKPEDLWTLAKYIKSLRPDYEFQFRHYKIDCANYALNDQERAVLKRLGLDYFCSIGAEMVLYCR